MQLLKCNLGYKCKKKLSKGKNSFYKSFLSYSKICAPNIHKFKCPARREFKIIMLAGIRVMSELVTKRVLNLKKNPLNLKDKNQKVIKIFKHMMLTEIRNKIINQKLKYNRKKVIKRGVIVDLDQ